MVESTQSSDTPNYQPTESTSEPSLQAVAEVVAELEKYRARLIEDFSAAAKKAKLPKSMTNAQLKAHPEIAKIDASLAKLRGEPMA